MVEGKKFAIDLLRGGDRNGAYHNGDFVAWPTGMKVSLGIPLARKTVSGTSEYHFPRDEWQPGWMLGDGLNILEGEDTYVLFGQGLQLHFEPAQGDNVKISLDRKHSELEKLAFDPSAVPEVVIGRDTAALEFFRFFNDVVGDVVGIGDKSTYKLLKRDYQETLCSEPVRSVMEKHGAKAVEVPEGF